MVRHGAFDAAWRAWRQCLTAMREYLCGLSSDSKPQILIICTSHDIFGNSNVRTGLWAEELAAPYYIFIDAGADVNITSIKGGRIPLDPSSLQGHLSGYVQRFLKDDSLGCLVENSIPLAAISGDYDVVFLPGGHGVCYDFPYNLELKALLEKFWAEGKLISAVCHGPAGFINVKTPSNESIIKGKRVTGFSNSEEKAVGKVNVVPFLLEDKLKELGALYVKGPDWKPYAMADGNLITGQNPQSSEKVAKLVLSALANPKKPDQST